MKNQWHGLGLNLKLGIFVLGLALLGLLAGCSSTPNVKQVPVGGAYTEGRGQGEIREPEIVDHFLDQGLYGLNITDLFPQIEMKDRSSRISCLQFVLQLQGFENIVSIIYG